MYRSVNVCDEVTPVDVVDGIEMVLVKALEETNMTAVGDPGFQSEEESGKKHGSIDAERCLLLQGFVVQTVFVRSAKGTICLWEFVVNFIFNPCIR